MCRGRPWPWEVAVGWLLGDVGGCGGVDDACLAAALRRRWMQGSAAVGGVDGNPALQ